MKKYLNTLFVTTQGAYLSKEGETVVVSVERETRLQAPIHTLGGIVCFGNVMMSRFYFLTILYSQMSRPARARGLTKIVQFHI